MSVPIQASLFDTGDVPSLGSLDGVTRNPLTRGAWIDVLPRWVAEPDSLFTALLEDAAWRADERQMYDRVVAVPRLLASYGPGERWPHPVVDEMREALSDHYESELGGRFVSAGLCLYRDGRDSVAWHGDYVAREMASETMVAIVSLGAPRRLALRPKGGGESLSFLLGPGDLLVMGGTCQRTWDHAIPKTAKPVGPRISVQLRPRWVA